MNKLSQSARRLALCVFAAASMIIASALFGFRADNPLKLTIWIVLAALAGAVKVRFPGTESSYSFGYFAVLAAMGMLRFPETVLISMTAALVQSYWQASKRPAGIQVLFNMFNYTISGALSWQVFHTLEHMAPELSVAVRFTAGASVFFLANSGLVSCMLALVSGRPLREVWENSQLLVLPYYIVGAAFAAILAIQSSPSMWLFIALLPSLALLYGCMRISVRRAGA